MVPPSFEYDLTTVAVKFCATQLSLPQPEFVGALTPNDEVYSSALALWHCFTPVRVSIYWSDVSTIFVRSSFVRMPTGYALPVLKLPAPAIVSIALFVETRSLSNL